MKCAAKEVNLIPYICPSCGKTIAWTLKGSACYCRKCKIWISSKDKVSR